MAAPRGRRRTVEPHLAQVPAWQALDAAAHIAGAGTVGAATTTARARAVAPACSDQCAPSRNAPAWAIYCTYGARRSRGRGSPGTLRSGNGVAARAAYASRLVSDAGPAA